MELTSTEWRVRTLAPGKFEVTTELVRHDGSDSELVTLRVFVPSADKLTGTEVHRAALGRAREIIDIAMKSNPGISA